MEQEAKGIRYQSDNKGHLAMDTEDSLKSRMQENCTYGSVEGRRQQCQPSTQQNKYIHGRTCVYNLNYHIVWCTKYRRKVLNPEISSRLVELLKDVASEKGFTLVEAKVGEGDHVHCFVSAPPKLSVTDIARWLKGISGRYLLMEYPEQRKRLWKGHLWNGSYFAESIGSTSEENILRYIERQKDVQL